jgi:hypothetical protein
VAIYFLYHEVGHLIQRSLGSADYKEFIDEKCEGDSIVEQHIREHDADWFSANQIALHIIPFAEKLNAANPGEEVTNLENITALALAGIYTYFIRRAKAYPKIYYQEHCHPHPSIRLSYMVIYLLDALSANIAFELNKTKILKNAILISEKLMIEPGGNIIEEYSKQLYESINEITAYINKIRNDSTDYPYTSLKVVLPKNAE